MEIKTETNIAITIDGDVLNLTKEDAEKLYNQLSDALGKYAPPTSMDSSWSISSWVNLPPLTTIKG